MRIAVFVGDDHRNALKSIQDIGLIPPRCVFRKSREYKEME